MNFSRQRIFLTGGNGGLGRPLTAELISAGADVTVVSRRPGDKPPAARHIAADLSTTGGIAEASAIVAREAPDILINMAGTQYFGPAEGQSLEAVLASYMVNLMAPAALCRATLRTMKRRNFGQIVNIGSIFGSISFAHFASYSSAKAGLRALSEALRRELAGTEIAVTYVAPRALQTGMLSSEMQKYAALTGMNVDAPERVAHRVLKAIRQRRKEVYIGFPERLLVRLNAVMPRVVDAAVASGDRKAHALFSS
jgi:short-subunit dehydrogenase